MSTPKHYPPAAWKAIPAGDNDPVMRPAVVVLHVDAGNSLSLFNWFNGPSGGIESHLHIRKDGTVEQYRAFDREADAQLGGNSWETTVGRLGSISVETQGTALGYWTRAQKAAIKEFLSWANHNLDIPLRIVDDPNPNTVEAGGIGYHSLFRRWNSLGKSCPGPKRIAWFKNKLTPWLAEQSKVYDIYTHADTVFGFCEDHGISVPRLWRLNEGPAPAAGMRLRVK